MQMAHERVRPKGLNTFMMSFRPTSLMRCRCAINALPALTPRPSNALKSAGQGKTRHAVAAISDDLLKWLVTQLGQGLSNTGDLGRLISCLRQPRPT